MEIKRKFLTLQETADFVSSVISTASIKNDNGTDTYLPALFDFAFRLHTYIYFADYKFKTDKEGNIDQDKAMAVVYGQPDFWSDFYEVNQLDSLYEACEEQAEYNQKEYLAVMQVAFHPEDQMVRLVDLIENLINNLVGLENNLDPELLDKLATALNGIDEEKLVKAVGKIHEQAEKKPRGRPKKVDNLIDIPT